MINIYDIENVLYADGRILLCDCFSISLFSPPFNDHQVWPVKATCINQKKLVGCSEANIRVLLNRLLIMFSNF